MVTGITLFGPWFEQTIKREKKTKTILSPEDCAIAKRQQRKLLPRQKSGEELKALKSKDVNRERWTENKKYGSNQSKESYSATLNKR